MAGQQKVDVNKLIEHIRAELIVRELNPILKRFHIPSSGLKGVLQNRLFDKIREFERMNDQASLQEIYRMAYDKERSGQRGAVVSRQGSYASSTASLNTGSYNNFNFQPPPQQRAVQFPPFTQGHQPQAAATTNLKFTFVPSPFYTVVDSLSTVVTVPPAQTTRSTLRTSIQFTPRQAEDLKRPGSEFRVLLFCAEYTVSSVYADHVVSFPQQCEIKVGDTAVNANTRGLRKRAGTTKPVDLTPYLSLNTGLPNMVLFTYALTRQVGEEGYQEERSKKFAYVIRLVRNVSVDTLVKRLRDKPEFISKESVLASMKKASDESDLIATASNMPLRCPLSTLRIQLPIRSKNCTHNQCVDATSYLELQTQAPTWACPICNKSSPYEMLVVDRYVQDILDNTSADVESVRVDPDGNWSIESVRAESILDSEDEDEKKPIVPMNNKPKFVTKGPYTPEVRRTSQLPIQENTPTSNGTTQGAGQKRTHDVIDLTLSDDDEPPPRPQKRVNDNPLPSPTPSSSVPHNHGRAGNSLQNGSLTETPPHLRFQLPPVSAITRQYPPPAPPTLDHTRYFPTAQQHTPQLRDPWNPGRDAWN